MVWGYLQYRLCGKYRGVRGGGGPGPEVPADRLVASGIYAYTRNPMYLGHIIFLTGLTLTLRSWLAALITVTVAVWLHFRVLADERNLTRETRTALRCLHPDRQTLGPRPIVDIPAFHCQDRRRSGLLDRSNGSRNVQVSIS